MPRKFRKVCQKGRMKSGYRSLPGGYVDKTGVHRGVPPTEEDFKRIALGYAHRTLFKEGPIKFEPHDPLPTQDVPSMIEFTQELPIKEVKMRYPSADVGTKP